jgi:hypothetical protein
VTRSFAVPVVREMVGLPPNPEAMFVVSSGEDWSAPVKEEAESLMASVSPVIVTDMVLAPVVGLGSTAVMPLHFAPSQSTLESPDQTEWKGSAFSDQQGIYLSFQVKRMARFQ